MANLLQPCSLTLQQLRMELALSVSMSQPLDNCKPNLNDKSMQNAIKSEMAVFGRSAVRGRRVQLVYSHSLYIPPTSVEAERAFS